MEALIMMLFNSKRNTFHPILYLEAPFPSSDSESKVKRFRSKMHHTGGFPTRDEAVEDIKTKLIPQVESVYAGHVVVTDLGGDLEWDGEGIPADTHLRAI